MLRKALIFWLFLSPHGLIKTARATKTVKMFATHMVFGVCAELKGPSWKTHLRILMM